MPRIDRIDARILDLPTVRGHVLSVATMRAQTIVLVRIRCSDGSEGLGEGTTIGGLAYCPESPESIQSAITTYIAPLLTGREADDVAALTADMERAVAGNPIARSSVEIALWDGLARRLAVPLHQLFGGAVADHLPVAWTLASGDTGRDIEEAQDALSSRRHNAFKMKIGKNDLAADLAHVARIARAVGDAASLRVDVNQAWGRSDAARGLPALAEIGIGLVEQPLKASDLEGLAALTRRGNVTILADEVLRGPEDALRVVRADAANALSVKVAQSGGLAAARDVIAIGRAGGLGLYGGTMLEAGLGSAASLHLFATEAPFEWGTEMLGPLLLADDILTEPLDYRDFGVAIPQGPGIGVTLDPDRVEHFARDRRRTLHPAAE